MSKTTKLAAKIRAANPNTNVQIGPSYEALVDEHIALLDEARAERDHHKQHASDLGVALSDAQDINADLLAALDHGCLRELFGEVEDSGTPEAARLWSLCLQWFDVRDEAVKKARE